MQIDDLQMMERIKDEKAHAKRRERTMFLMVVMLRERKGASGSISLDYWLQVEKEKMSRDSRRHGCKCCEIVDVDVKIEV
jgi:hypothetical protein